MIKPDLIVAVDPDSTNTAVCFAELRAGTYRLQDVCGGGSGAPVAWNSITGARDLMRDKTIGLRSVVLVVEAQTPFGSHSESVEGCRRARWHWDAAAELLGIDRVHVLPTEWQLAFVPIGSEWRPLGTGSKAAYRKRAHAIGGAKVRNEDRAAAVGMTWWYTMKLGCPLTRIVS